MRSALRYDLMGIIPRGESPWGWAPTICFGMATDAINVSETTYLTAVQYYLANLGTTMESQVRSSVAPCYSVSLLPFYCNLYSDSSLLPCASLCAAPLPLYLPRTTRGTSLTQSLPASA